MRIRVFLLIASQVVISICFGFAQNDSLANYYKHVNKAELCLINDSFSLASQEYLNAFKYHFPFQKDLNNAFATEINDDSDYETVLRFVKSVKKNSIGCMDDSLFVKYLALQDDKIAAYSDKLLKNLADIKCSNLKVDNKVLNKIDSIFLLDQNARESYTGSANSKAFLNRTDSTNSIELKKIYQASAHGFDERIFTNNSYKIDIMILHFIKMNNETSIFWREVIKNEVLKGRIRNDAIIGIIDFADIQINQDNETDLCLHLSGVACMKYLKVNLKENMLSKVNIERKKYFIEDYYSSVQKDIWVWRNPESSFYIKSVYYYIMCDDFEVRNNEVAELVQGLSETHNIEIIE